MKQALTDASIDRFLRLLAWLCVAAGLLMVYTIAPLYAPHANASEAVLLDKCLEIHGFPILDSWTGQMTGCGR